ncbi:MAG: hypothetical protein DYG93_03685 [Leptolyngbya sp. PLA2]|nr:hypothetical protein [Leptolyngbya sp.]MCE7970755.1 hypothetical protein [Leptolyngbya sp. PL-A2]MCQ3939910.1 hypothetical protein [cyanobacterium CYA1]MDL1903345.1 hypothetical protein [Synechococcales cyanobacterium CNB]GIK18040.1 MAG: hypothetical protein BroJett004_02040 [Planctomycetota bacterium]
MISIARRVASNAFGMGIAVGLILSLQLPLMAHGAVWDDEHPVCNGGVSVPPEIQPWVDLQCQVHQAIFADAAEPSAAYVIDTAVQGPGYYTGINHEEREIEFEAVWVVQVDVESVTPELAAQGVTCHPVIGRLSGDEGQVPIAGVVIRTRGVILVEEDVFLLLVNAVLSEADFEVFAQAGRIAGGVRIIDATTLSSTPLALATSAEAMWIHGSDVSTIFRQGGNVPGVDVACVERAYRRYNIAVNAANQSAEACYDNAWAVFVICMTGCGVVATVIPGVSWIASVVCVGLCVATSALMYEACGTQHSIALDAAKQQLALDLEACGVVIVEP